MKRRILILKVIIILGVILSIIFFFLAFKLNIIPEDNNNYELYNNLAKGTLIILGINCVAMYILSTNTNIFPKKVNPKKYLLFKQKYASFEKELISSLKNDNFIYKGKIENSFNCSSKYFVKKCFCDAYIVLIIYCSEMSEKLKTQYFKYFLEQIIYLNPELTMKENFYFTHIICVDKSNNNFTRWIEKNVEQSYGKFNLPIGVSFEEQKIFIGTQKGGFFISKYYKLVKKIKKYIKMELIKK